MKQWRPNGLSSYGMGWQVSLGGNGEIVHTGENPEISPSYMGFRPHLNIGWRYWRILTAVLRR